MNSLKIMKTFSLKVVLMGPDVKKKKNDSLFIGTTDPVFDA